MTTATVNGHVMPAEQDRLRVLPSGARIVRLTGQDLGWLVEYRRILQVAARDFLKRGRLDGEPDQVLAELAGLLTEGGAVWLITDPAYRLLGFAAAKVRPAAWTGALLAEVPCAYLYPRKTPRDVCPALAETIFDWARRAGAARVLWMSRRMTDPAWQRIAGAKRIAVVYEHTLEASHG